MTLLRVDLGTGASAVEEVDRRGFLAVEELLAVPSSPLWHPDQPVVFVAGFSGRRALALNRFSLVARSPLTGGIAESRVEGPFGPALADLGHTAVSITGRAPRPSYLLLGPGSARVLDAADLWGADTTETTDRLLERHGLGAHVAAIGPAGENLVRFAGVVADYSHPAARMGLGAMLGAKLLKAVVVTGGSPAEFADPAAVVRITDDYQARINANPLTLSQKADPGFGAWPASGLDGYLGVRNYSTSGVNLAGFTPEAYRARLSRSSGGCPGCPQDCLKSFDGHTLHQEAVAAFAGNLAIEDLGIVLELNAWCHRTGVDPVSLAGVLAFRCELAQDGLLAGPAFGDADALTALAAKIVQGDDILAKGVARASRLLGFEPYAMHSKGIELPAFDPRGCQGLGLAYAVHPLGPRYDAVEHDIDFDPVDGFLPGEPMATLTESKVDHVADLMELWSGYDAAGLCLFAAPPTRNLDEDSAASLLAAVTGWPITPGELRAWGQRRLALMRRYNLREGLRPALDTLPSRFFTRPIDSGRHTGAVLDPAVFEAAVTRLTALLGWL
ncbi:aldehyde:ferredoxin oxidoreductase [Amycolatopsis xylanica]|uniref:Aldehyde:ferredoxin oxidoreductase n=1 Tax=Amycolatopsis xylanica TaxID=589385 RepID=A0A1H2T380_9PSEU|nr:aldehyde ferredoxin oxidoreductase C-terminal domain-containing protein [Amycolatopsis xylanica]SDW38321.1 aldehyde:ferredoxin oxidoreductase [Amycolatopsis xylanica]